MLPAPSAEVLASGLALAEFGLPVYFLATAYH